MQTTQFESIDLEQLERVAGGGKIWHKITHTVQHWAADVTNFIVDDAKEHAENASWNGNSATTDDINDFSTETAAEG